MITMWSEKSPRWETDLIHHFRQMAAAAMAGQSGGFENKWGSDFQGDRRSLGSFFVWLQPLQQQLGIPRGLRVNDEIGELQRNGAAYGYVAAWLRLGYLWLRHIPGTEE